MVEVEPFPKTYQRGHKNVFDPQIVEGAMPSTKTQNVDKGKDKVIEPVIHDEEDTHETKQEFQLVDLDEDENEKIANAAIKGKDFKIKELQTNLDSAKYVINFLE